MLNIVVLKDTEQIEVFSYSNEKLKNEIKDITDLKEIESHLILYPKNLNSSEEILNILKKESNNCNIKELSQSGITLENLKEFDYNQIKDTLINESFTQFSLHRNLSLLDQFHPTINHLSHLLFADRLSFYEELWHILKSNTASVDASLIYNGFIAKKQTKEEKELNEPAQKGDLVKNIVVGPKHPQTQIKSDLALKIMAEYKNQLSSSLEVLEFDSKKGTFILSASINESPFIFMAKSFNFTILQEKVLKALIEGININLGKSK